MQTFWKDLRLGFRLIKKQPVFSFVTILALAIGIGANTTIFSMVNGVLLRPLPYRQPGEGREFQHGRWVNTVRLPSGPSVRCA